MGLKMSAVAMAQLVLIVSVGDVRLGNVNDAPFLKRILLSDHKKCMLQRRDMGHIDFSRAVFILQDK